MSQQTVMKLVSQIMYGTLTNEELSRIGLAIKYRRAQIVRENRSKLTVGTSVKFTHPKTGRLHKGNVTKIKIKNVQVREGLTTWNVPANMLTVAE